MSEDVEELKKRLERERKREIREGLFNLHSIEVRDPMNGVGPLPPKKEKRLEGIAEMPFVPPTMTPRISPFCDLKYWKLEHLHVPYYRIKEQIQVSFQTKSAQLQVNVCDHLVTGVIRRFPLTFWRRSFKYSPEEILSHLHFIAFSGSVDKNGVGMGSAHTDLRLFPFHYYLQGGDLYFTAKFCNLQSGGYWATGRGDERQPKISLYLDKEQLEGFYKYDVSVDLWVPFDVRESERDLVGE